MKDEHAMQSLAEAHKDIARLRAELEAAKLLIGELQELNRSFFTDLEAARRDNAQLAAAHNKARELIREVMGQHSDPEQPEYNECDKAECHWCEVAKTLFNRDRSVTLRDLLAPTIVLEDNVKTYLCCDNLARHGRWIKELDNDIARLRSLCGKEQGK